MLASDASRYMTRSIITVDGGTNSDRVGGFFAVISAADSGWQDFSPKGGTLAAELSIVIIWLILLACDN